MAAGSVLPRIAVLTGAGVSADSGVPTFRGEDGLWLNHRVEDLATPAAYARDPRLVWEWYAWRRSVVRGCAPNDAHRALARLDAAAPDFLLATQNVDGLHQRAGSRRVEALHGDLFGARCPRDGTVWPDATVDPAALPPRCPACGADGRPHILWFGESYAPAQLARVQAFFARAELVLVIGTSGAVALASLLVDHARRAGARLIELNTDKTCLSSRMDEVVLGPAGKTLPALVDRLLAGNTESPGGV